MKERSMQRPIITLLTIMLLALVLLFATVACGAEPDAGSGADSQASERREDADESPSEKEEEDAAGDEDDSGGETDKPEREEQTEDDDEEQEPTPEPPKDTGILKRLTGGDSGDVSFASDVLALLPTSELFTKFTAYDVRSILAAEGVGEPLQREIEESFSYMQSHCVSHDQVETIVALNNWNFFIEGSFSLADLRALLDGDGYVREEYRGHELWATLNGGGQLVAIFEERNAVLMGNDFTVRQVLKDLNRGNELFLEGDSHLRQVFDKARNGLKIKLNTPCSGEYCQVFATAIVTALSDEEYAADIELVVLTDSDDVAEAVKDEVRASVEHARIGIEIIDASHETDDGFVLVRATIDEESVEDWQRYLAPPNLVFKPGSPPQPFGAGASPFTSELPQRECPPGNR